MRQERQHDVSQNHREKPAVKLRLSNTEVLTHLHTHTDVHTCWEVQILPILPLRRTVKSSEDVPTHWLAALEHWRLLIAVLSLLIAVHQPPQASI